MADERQPTQGETINYDHYDGERMADKPFAELDSLSVARIASGRPQQLREYADAAAAKGNSELLAAIGTAAFMQFRVPQGRGIRIPDDEFSGYQDTYDYVHELTRQLHKQAGQ